MKRTGFRRALGTYEQRRDFRNQVIELDGGCCMIGRSLCEGPLQAAHVIPKRRLRDMGHGAEIVYSPNAAMTLCERHHTRHDGRLEIVPFSYVPRRCIDFIEDLNLIYVLRNWAA